MVSSITLLGLLLTVYRDHTVSHPLIHEMRRAVRGRGVLIRPSWSKTVPGPARTATHPDDSVMLALSVSIYRLVISTSPDRDRCRPEGPALPAVAGSTSPLNVEIEASQLDLAVLARNASASPRSVGSTVTSTVSSSEEVID